MTSIKEAAAKTKVFYGWYIIGMAAAAGFVGSGVSQQFMGVMLKPMTEDLGWSRTEVSGAMTAGTICAGLTSPIFGRLTDRYGPRLLASLGALLVGAIYFMLAGVSALWQFYLIFMIGRTLSSVTLTGVVPLTAAANWFRKKRGRAMGLIAMSTPLGSSLLALTAQLIIEDHGWRIVFVIFGVAMIGLIVLPLALIMRKRPEDIGLLPDGEVAVDSDGGGKVAAPPPPDEYGWTLREAMHTPTLWLLISALGLGILANGAIGFHQVAYYTDVGIAATAAAVALTTYGISGAVANAIWGFLVERYSERHLASAAMIMAAAGLFYLLFVETLPMALGFSVVFGLAARGESSLVMMIVAQYYGRSSYGTISGFIGPFQMLGLGLGPLVASIAFDLTGSYEGVFLLFSIGYMVAAGLMWLARKPVLPPLRSEAAG